MTEYVVTRFPDMPVLPNITVNGNVKIKAKFLSDHAEIKSLYKDYENHAIDSGFDGFSISRNLVIDHNPLNHKNPKSKFRIFFSKALRDFKVILKASS